MKYPFLLLTLLAGLFACTGNRKVSGITQNPANADTIVFVNGQSLHIHAYVWVDLMPGTNTDEGGMNLPLHVAVTPVTTLSISEKMIGALWFLRGDERFEVEHPGWNGKEIFTSLGPSWSWDKPVTVACSFIDENGKKIFVRSAEVNIEKVY